MKVPWYCFLTYTDNLPEGVGGDARGPFIRIKHKYSLDAGLHAHEVEHVKQWYKTLSLHSLLYLLIKPYKYWAELQAYKEQCKYGLSKESAARFICNYYKLKLDYNKVLKDLNR